MSPGNNAVEIGDLRIGRNIIKITLAVARTPEIKAQGGDACFGQCSRSLHKETPGLTFGAGESMRHNDQLFGVSLVERCGKNPARTFDAKKFFAQAIESISNRLLECKAKRFCFAIVSANVAVAGRW